MILNIFKKGIQDPIFSVGKFTATEEIRAGRSISIKITLDKQTEFIIKDNSGDYQYFCEYNKETYNLRDKPSYSKNLNKLSYEYTLIFKNSYSDLEGLYFKDILPRGEECNFTSDFAFNGTITQFKYRLQANLDNQIGEGIWDVVFTDGYIPSNDAIITMFSKQKISEVLSGIIWDEAKVNYSISGNTITLGDTAEVIPHIFDYNKGLSKKEKSMTTDKPITRINGTGGTRNIPFNYYRNLFKKYVDNLPDSGDKNITYILNSDKTAWKWTGSSWIRDLQGWSDTSDKLMPKILRDTWVSSRVVKKWYDIESEYPFNDYTEDDNEDIYPSIKDGRNSLGQPIDILVSVPKTYNDEIATDGKLKEGFFDIQINNLGFDLFKAISTQGDLTVLMQSGINAGTRYVVGRINGNSIRGYFDDSLFLKNQNIARGKITVLKELEVLSSVIVPEGFSKTIRRIRDTHYVDINKYVNLGSYKTQDSITRRMWVYFSPLIMDYSFYTDAEYVGDFNFSIRYYLKDYIGNEITLGNKYIFTRMNNGKDTTEVIGYISNLDMPDILPNTSYNIMVAIEVNMSLKDYDSDIDFNDYNINIDFTFDVKFKEGEPFISDNPILVSDRPSTSNEEPIVLTVNKDISTMGENVVRPTNLFPLAIGDKFIFENIDFSAVAETYITNAEKKLEDYLLEKLANKSVARFNYSLELSKDYVANEDISKIRAGNILKVETEENQIDITSVSISYGDSFLPKYTIASSETKKYSEIVNNDIKKVNTKIRKSNEDIRYELYKQSPISITSQVPSSPIAPPTSHEALNGRELPNQHPLSAITDLGEAMSIHKTNEVIDNIIFSASVTSVGAGRFSTLVLPKSVPNLISGEYGASVDITGIGADIPSAGGGGGVSSWIDLTDKPLIGGKELRVGDNSLSYLGIAGSSWVTTQIDNAIKGLGSVFIIMGSKPTPADLPKSGNIIGQVWFVESESVGYIWINKQGVEQWEKFGEAVDYSAFLTKAEAVLIYASKVDLQGHIDRKDNPHNVTRAQLQAAYINGDISQEFKASKLIGSTLVIPRGVPSLISGEYGASVDVMGIGGDVPSGGGTGSWIDLTDKPLIGGKELRAGDNSIGYLGLVAEGDYRLSNPRVASDVYSWAKQPTKPTYTASEVGALGAGGTAANSNMLNGKTLAQVNATAKGYVDGLEIGGVNLLKGTSKNWVNSTNPSSIIIYNNTPTNSIGLKYGDNISLRVKVRNSPTDFTMSLGFTEIVNGAGHGLINSSYIAANTENEVFLQGIVPNKGNYLYIVFRTTNIDYSELKLEAGNKPTAWSPAPEDMILKQGTNLQFIKGDGSLDSTEYLHSSEAVLIYASKVDLQGHIDRKDNPHNVTRAQLQAAYINGDISQEFKASKLIGSTLVIPRGVPSLISGEYGASVDVMGIGGDVPSGGGTGSWIDLTDKPLINGKDLKSGDNTLAYLGLVGDTDVRLSNSRPASDVSAWAKASVKPSYVWSDIGNKPDVIIEGDYRLTNARPASDVYSWAKQPTKPTYTFSEIGNKPTTLDGYGITDDIMRGGIYNKYDTDVNNLPLCRLYYSEYKSNSNSGGVNAPTVNGVILSIQGDDEGIQLWESDSAEGLFHRRKWNSYNSWRKVLDDTNFHQYALPINGTAVNSNALGGLSKSNFSQNINYNTSSQNTGWYKIKIGYGKPQWMIDFNITLYQNYKHSNILISGYNYANSYWYSPYAILASSSLNSLDVKFGYDGVNQLWVAIPAGLYTGINISNIANGFTYYEDWSKLIEIELVDTLTGTIQKEITAYRPLGLLETAKNAELAASATKLQTPRTIFGQPFDGTGNVSGKLSALNAQFRTVIELYNTDYTNRLTFHQGFNEYAMIYVYSDNLQQFKDLRFGSSDGKTSLNFNATANKWGVGTLSPTHKLEVAGTFSASTLVLPTQTPTLLAGEYGLATDIQGIASEMPNIGDIINGKLTITTSSNVADISAYGLKIVQGWDSGTKAYDSVLISANDVATLRLVESDGTMLGMCAGEQYATFATSKSFRFYVGSDLNSAIYSGANGTKIFSITSSGIDVTGAITSGNIASSGNITAMGSITPNYSSDMRLKENIQIITPKKSLEIIGKLSNIAIEYDWNNLAKSLNPYFVTKPHSASFNAQLYEGILGWDTMADNNGYLMIGQTLLPYTIVALSDHEKRLQKIEKMLENGSNKRGI